MNIRFFIVKGKQNFSSIYVRFWDSKRFDQKTRTGFSVRFDDWSNVKQQVKNTTSAIQRDFINENLRKIENFIYEQYTIDYSLGKPILEHWLKEKINLLFSRAEKDELYKVYFTDWIVRFIDKAPETTNRGKAITKKTIQKYITVKNKIINFEKYTSTRIRFQNIDLDFYNNFLNYCKNVEVLNDNSIGSHIAIIKKWCKLIENEGLPINKAYRDTNFTVITNKTKDVYLNESEINKIFDFDLSHSPRLDNARDNFIIGLRTGLRISDFLNLKGFHIKNDTIEIETQKTSKTVLIPMHKQVKEILAKRNGQFPTSISDQKFNVYIKEVCKLVGINEMTEGAKVISKKNDKAFFASSKVQITNTNRKQEGIYPKYELISSHTCRRSFASNLYGKLPNMTIMAITGHTTESSFLKYIKITPTENAEKLKQYWEKQNDTSD
jgi:integrase